MLMVVGLTVSKINWGQRSQWNRL